MNEIVNPIQAKNLKHVAHGFYTRIGGVSQGIYSSLNCGRGSKDSRDCVEENRNRVAASFGLTSQALIGPRQIHSARAVLAETSWSVDQIPEADAIVTCTPGLIISVLTADCVPLLLDGGHVIAGVHAGWKGAKSGVVEAALDLMVSQGANVPDVRAAIGPCISAEAYEVGAEFKQAFLDEDGENSKYFIQNKKQQRPHFDLTAYVKQRLLVYGVTNICDLGMCTYKNESKLFSHRRSVHRGEPDYGRQISAIVLL